MKRWFLNIITSKLFVKYHKEKISVKFSDIIRFIYYRFYRIEWFKTFKKLYKGEYYEHKSRLVHNVRLDQLCTHFDHDPIEASHHDYHWDKLENSIKKYGLINYPEATICNDYGVRLGLRCDYCLLGGNHRVAILRKLYGLDYKITIKVYEMKEEYKM